MTPSPAEIRVSAAIILDAERRALLVRKRGTTRFMQPGGKPDPGETPAETVRRELAEEVGLRIAPADLTALGVYRADAANEAGTTVVADVFLVVPPVDATAAVAAAEIAELRWITEDEAADLPLAPLSEVLLPLAWAGVL